MKIKWMLLLALPSLAQAMKFDCYTIPSSPINAFQYRNGSCGASEKIPKEAQTIPDGPALVVCTMQAYCRARPAGSMRPPRDYTTAELGRRIPETDPDSELKHSTLMCTGKANFVNGQPRHVICPDASSCQSEVYYNLVGVNVTNIYAPTSVVAPAVDSTEVEQ